MGGCWIGNGGGATKGSYSAELLLLFTAVLLLLLLLLLLVVAVLLSFDFVRDSYGFSMLVTVHAGSGGLNAVVGSDPDHTPMTLFGP